MQPVVVFELNEVPWRIVDWWVTDHPDSALATVLAHADTYTTVAPDDGHLSPWITWPTLHRGVPNTVHGIAHFGQDTAAADADTPTWWSVAVEAGRRVGLFGLLHTSPLPADVDRYAFLVPDTFAPTAQTHPTALEPFQAFNLAMSRASARNVSTSIDRSSAAAFLRSAPKLGLRPATVLRLARQLVDERRRPTTRVRRRSYQSVVAFDLFMGQVRAAQPDAAAFFTNHVASAMHRYWAATFPADYPPDEFGFDDDWIATWKDELAEAVGHADRMLGRLMAHCDAVGARLVVVSSMGQQAAQGSPVGQLLFLRDLNAFVRAAGLDPAAVDRRPAMDPHVSMVIRDDADRARLLTHLDQLAVGGQPIVRTEEPGGFVSLEFGQADSAIGEITVGGVACDPATVGLEIVVIEDEVASTAYHVTEGILIDYDPGRGRTDHGERPEILTTEVAPFLLGCLDIEPSSHHPTDRHLRV